jgi:hypothetical protein
MYGSSVLLPLISLSLPRSLSVLLYSCFILSQPFPYPFEKEKDKEKLGKNQRESPEKLGKNQRESPERPMK